MLFPALNKARETARGIQCANNFKQQGIWLFAYQDAYNDYLLGCYSQEKPSWFVSSIWWEIMMHGEVGSILGLPGARVIDGNPWSYLKQANGTAHCRFNPTWGVVRFFNCPTGITYLHNMTEYKTNGRTNSKNFSMVLTYGYGHYLNRGDEKDSATYPRLRKMSQLRKFSPSELFVMGDNWKRNIAEDRNNDNSVYYIGNTNFLSIGAYKAHNGGANILYGDGHVAMTNDPNAMKFKDFF